MSKYETKLVSFKTNKFFDVEKLVNKNPELYNELCEKYPIKKNECVYAIVYKKEADVVTESLIADGKEIIVNEEPVETLAEDSEPEVDVESIVSQTNSILCRGTAVVNGKLRIYHYYKTHGSKEFNKFLKNEYGMGGWSEPNGQALWTSSNGLELRFKDQSKVSVTWNEVAESISDLISNGLYLTKEELEQYEANPNKYVPVNNDKEVNECVNNEVVNEDDPKPIQNPVYLYDKENKLFYETEEKDVENFLADSNFIVITEEEFKLKKIFTEEEATQEFPEDFQPLYKVGEEITISYENGARVEAIKITEIKLEYINNEPRYYYYYQIVETGEVRICGEPFLCNHEVLK